MKRIIVLLSTMGLMSCGVHYKIEVSNGYYTPMEKVEGRWKTHWFSYSTEHEARTYIQSLHELARARREFRKKRYIKVK